MGLSEGDLSAIRYKVRPGPIRGPGMPLTQSERQAIWRLRKKGILPPYPRLKPGLVANGEVDPKTGCLVWMRSRDTAGYGRIKRNGRDVAVHRLALEAKLGRPLAPGMVARHICDNPPCFNPHHLEEGTLSENMRDYLDRGRHR